MNPFKVLEITESSTLEEIKKAYRRLAIKHHPDKNNGSKESEEKFKEISRAFDSINTEAKVSKYKKTETQYSAPSDEGAFKGNGVFGDYDFSEYFKEMDNIYKNIKKDGFRANYIKQEPTKIYATVKECLKELTKNIVIELKIKCDYCRGSGGSGVYCQCKICKGQGMVSMQLNSITGFSKIDIKCDSCNGKGGRHSNICSGCNGLGNSVKKERNTIKLKKKYLKGGGIDTLSEEGSRIRIIIEDDKFFFEDEECKKLQSIEYVSIIKIITGGAVEVETLKGSIRMNITENSQNKKYRLKGLGVDGGDHIVIFDAYIPKIEEITREDVEAIKRIGAFEQYK
jgi:molecular chaperone DnaJ